MKDSIGKASLKVGQHHFASTMKTGTVNVLSTAILAALMEEASCDALKTASIVSGETTVGTSLNLVHRRPSALGAEVTAVAKLSNIDKKGVHFDIEAFDETGLIGTAKHIRVFVNQAEFEKKCMDMSLKSIKKHN